MVRLKLRMPIHGQIVCGGSSDYYNYCTSNSGLFGLLSNQNPRTGLGMAGIALYGSWIYHNYREYISGKLYYSLVRD